MSHPLSRRALLRGASGLAVSLPLLRAMSASAATAPPKRVIFLYTPNGQYLSAFKPTGSGAAFQLSSLLQPLAPHRSDLLLFSNLDNLAANANPGNTNGHNAGITSILTGTTLQPQSGLNNVVNNELRGYATGPSIDQVLANEHPEAKQLKYHPLIVGAGTRTYEFGQRDPYSYVSYRTGGAAGAEGAQENPAQVFQSLFSQGTPTSAAVDPLARRRSILDFVATRYAPQNTSLMARLGAEDRATMDRHLTAIRELEQRIQAPAASSCVAPPLGTGNDFRTPALAIEQRYGLTPALGAFQDGNDWSLGNHPQTMRAMQDLVVMALACDLTRVAVLQFACAQSGPAPSWAANTSEDQHGITHALDQPSMQDAQRKISTWYAAQLAALIAALKKVPEGSGTLFDSTAIVWFTEMADAAGHTMEDLPIVMAGAMGGALRTGQLVNANHRSQADLWLALAQGFGLSRQSFGDARFCKGALPGVLV
ncbi:MAG: DUF1552 domain-containing protein [Myxococcaceae bacterium]|nr:DUF1552 domain-containing protein [Myxococcaceae bacterium]